MTTNKRKTIQEMTPEAAAYQEWREKLRADPEYQAIYEEEAARGELWLQLVDARQRAGLTQAQMAERLGVSLSEVERIEDEGFDVHSLKTLRRYVEALGEGFSLEVVVHIPDQAR